MPASAAPFTLFGYHAAVATGSISMWSSSMLVVCYRARHQPDAHARRARPDRGARPLSLRRDHGHQSDQVRTLSFGLAAFFAGIGGALYAHYQDVVSNEGFTIDRSILFLAMVIIGGLGSIMGTLMGTAFMVLLPEAMECLERAAARQRDRSGAWR